MLMKSELFHSKVVIFPGVSKAHHDSKPYLTKGATPLNGVPPVLITYHGGNYARR
jgi:hypothetical protein